MGVPGRRPRLTGPKAIERQMRISHHFDEASHRHELGEIGESESPPVSQQAIHQLLKRALGDLLIEPLEQIRMLELLRLASFSRPSSARPSW